jgi:hypothetical protein
MAVTVSPRPEAYDGLAVGFWTFVQRDAIRMSAAADCAATLVGLHVALRTYPGELPGLAPTVVDLTRWLDLQPAGSNV